MSQHVQTQILNIARDNPDITLGPYVAMLARGLLKKLHLKIAPDVFSCFMPRAGHTQFLFGLVSVHGLAT